MSADRLYEAFVPCRDAAGRMRHLRIAQTQLGEVAIIVPPGTSAIVTADQVSLVCDALREARTRITGGGSS